LGRFLGIFDWRRGQRVAFHASFFSDVGQMTVKASAPSARELIVNVLSAPRYHARFFGGKDFDQIKREVVNKAGSISTGEIIQAMEQLVKDKLVYSISQDGVNFRGTMKTRVLWYLRQKWNSEKKALA
jgi:hypothetical protein